MYIRVCDTRVTVQSGDANPISLPGKSASFLRLLLLWDDGPVSACLAAHVLDVNLEAIPTHVGNLRDGLGDRDAKVLVETIPGDSRRVPPRLVAYRANLKADLTSFQTLTDEALEIAGREWTNHRNLTPESASNAESLLDNALSMWRGSPAVGLDHAGKRHCERKKLKGIDDLTELDGQRERLVDIFDQWKTRHADAELLRADCTLVLDTSNRGSTQVLDRMTQLVRIRPTDDRVWFRILFAASRLDDKKRVAEFYTRAREHFESDKVEVPEEVREFEPPGDGHRGSSASHARQSGVAHAITHPKGAENRTEIDGAVAPIVKALGIRAPSFRTLGEGDLGPLEYTERAENRLDFAGVLAGKWVDTQEASNYFVAMLRRFQARNPRGRARFLVIRPDSEAYEKLVQIRGGEVSPRSVKKLVRLREMFPCLEVRGTDRLPAFRVLMIDDDIVVVSPYDLENQSEASSRLGWQAPHMLLDPYAPFPLAPAFRMHFETEWNAAEDLWL